jgi:putative hydrolase of HD superfamily
MTESQPSFNFQPPSVDPAQSEIINTTLRLAALVEQLSMEGRTLTNHGDGRAENVAEHSLMLAIIAPAIAEQSFPQLEPNLVARFATIHDAVEAYVGDTPTHQYEKLDVAAKEAREAQGLAQLAVDYRELPAFTSLIQDYEQQQIPEARFVRVLDKLMPLVIHFQDDGATLRSYTNREALLAVPSARNQYLRAHYPEFEKLIMAREELATLAAQTLLED